jgi:ADP-ribosylglycohydrolase
MMAQQPHRTPRDAIRDRIRGALIGLATGDALGTTNEYLAPGTFNPITDMMGGGKFALPPGWWTDATSLALCLAESLIARRCLDPADQLARYLRWYRSGHLSSTGACFDIGITTRAALLRFEETGAVEAASNRRQATNDSLMRLAPVPMLFWQRDDVAELAGRSSTTTHAAPLCIDCCRYLGALIAGAIRGATRDELLAPGYTLTPGAWTMHPLEPEVDNIARGSFQRRDPPDIRGSGYCVETLEAALWAFHNSTDFATGALLAVNLGDDSDATGAIYGQLAGAFYGESGIPRPWRDRLALPDVIDGYAEALYELSLEQ